MRQISCSVAGRGHLYGHAEGKLLFRGDDFATVIMAAGRADMMWPLKFAAIRAFRMGFRPECMMRAAHIAF